jgi:uncharacterized membrane protein
MQHFSTGRTAAKQGVGVSVHLLALLLGAFTGLRTMSAPLAVSIAARIGWLDLSGTPLAFLGYAWTPWILAVCALAELVADQLPSTPSRLLAGMLGGAAVGAAGGSMIGGLLAGAAGAVIGTLGGYRFRMALAKSFGSDRPAAIIEDAIAYVGVALVVTGLP